MSAVSFGSRLSQLASERGTEVAVHYAYANGSVTTRSWAHIEATANRIAWRLAGRGVGPGTYVFLALPSAPDYFAVTYGVWKAGGCAVPVNPSYTPYELDHLVSVATPAVLIGDMTHENAPTIGLEDLLAASSTEGRPFPDRTPEPGKAATSGGSTGRPKLIVDPRPWKAVPGHTTGALGHRIGFRPNQRQLVAGRMFHNGPFCWAHWGLFEGHSLVVMKRFDASHAVELIRDERVEFGLLVPTMMRRIIDVTGLDSRSFSSIKSFWHAAAPCPPWLKRRWIELLGADRLNEAYGATEATGSTAISGTEWLAHPGSVGQPVETSIRILAEDGSPVGPGIVGEVFMRPIKAMFMPIPDEAGPSYRYLGAPPAAATSDGHVSVGDLGWVDDEGYLFLADRRVDMIITGGVNVYPAEVEAVLAEHPAVYDVAVIGVPDEDWGRRVHAVIQPASAGTPPSVDELDAYCRERLVSLKCPRSFEFVDVLPRDPTYSKIRRSDLVAERQAGWTPAMQTSTTSR